MVTHVLLRIVEKMTFTQRILIQHRNRNYILLILCIAVIIKPNLRLNDSEITQ